MWLDHATLKHWLLTIYDSMAAFEMLAYTSMLRVTALPSKPYIAKMTFTNITKYKLRLLVELQGS